MDSSGTPGHRAPLSRRDLTPEDLRILGLVARGLTDRAIGLALNRTQRTVSNRIGSILLKLGTANRTEAAVLAVSAGWIHYCDSEDGLQSTPVIAGRESDAAN